MAKLINQQLLDIGLQIQQLADTLDLDIIDACLLYCQQTGTEIEIIGDIVNKNQRLKAQAQRYAEQINILKKTTRLPTT